MSDYTKNTNWSTKDTLPTGNPNKVVKGVEFDAEFDDIATAITSKANKSSPSFTGSTSVVNLDVTGTFHIDSTGAAELPAGTEAQRPTPVAGMLRFNSDDNVFEGYDGTEWGEIGGAGLVELVANGGITVGDAVVSVSDGRVQVVEPTSTDQGTGTAVNLTTGSVPSGAPTIVLKDDSFGIIVYRDTDLKVTAFSISGNTLTLGSAVTIKSGGGSVARIPVYDPVEDLFVVPYVDVGVMYLRTISYSGTTLTANTEVNINSSFDNEVFLFHLPTEAVTLIVGEDAGNAAAAVVSYTGTTPSLSTPVTSSPSNVISSTWAIYNSTDEEVWLFMARSGSPTGPTWVHRITYASSTVTVASEFEIDFGASSVASSSLHDGVWDSDNDCAWLVFRQARDGGSLSEDIGKITYSGGFSDELFLNGLPANVDFVNTALFKEAGDASVLKVYFRDDVNDYQKVGTWDIGASSLTNFTEEATVKSSAGGAALNQSWVDVSGNAVVLLIDDSTDSQLVVYNNVALSTNADDFIGFAQETVADGELVKVATADVIDETQTGLTPQTTYYVDDDGTLSASDTGYPVAGYALTATKLRVGA